MSVVCVLFNSDSIYIYICVCVCAVPNSTLMQGVVGDIANRILAINPMILPLLVNGCFIGTLHQLFTSLYTHIA